ncbi:cytochrome P450 [Sistotremastrum suecicum HHB10207 ss-3]|uniref:Cytochrome P450 n=1 Tax=Sistotremastrum suecicum HHB10207 ss-3 TaxID=1314776 RepID=A0A166C0V0_9AGAM|nr:cytochrome P450 [Sistotremastrum suecicum HHB10207 ss-3]
MHPVAQVLALALATYILGGLVLKVIASRKNGPLPPGPKPLFLVGNVVDLPKSHDWFTFEKWGKQYGDVVHVSALGQPIIVLNSHRACLDLLEKKSSIYSDRPRLPMGGDLIGWKNAMALCPYTDRFRSMRKYLGQITGPRNAKQFWELEEQETKRFLRIIYDDSLKSGSKGEMLPHRIRGLAGSIISIISYGYRPLSDNDPVIGLADKAIRQFSLATAPGAWLVDVLPAMKHIPAWFPFASFQRTAANHRETLESMVNIPYNTVKEQVATASGHHSFAHDLAQRNETDKSQDDGHIIKWTAASLYSGGADTTVSAIYSLFLAMTLYPEIQKKAQAQLDAVLIDRLPTLRDREEGSLPYIEALVKEILRWAPVGPTGIPHRLTQDDQYRGWHIPKGSLVISNIWGITHDETIYPDAAHFKPERFLAEEESSQPDPRPIVFGYGRRVCPGQYIAEQSLWIAAAMILSVFSISPVPGETPKFEYESGTVSHPKPFSCLTAARSSKAKALLESLEINSEVIYMPSSRDNHI